MNTHGSNMSDACARFEDGLRQDVSDAHVDYETLWNALSKRIGDAEAEGALYLLNGNETPSEGFWDRVEQVLGERIQQHEEYEVPVDECIAGSGDLAEARWRSLEAGLMDRIARVEELPSWEQVLKADEIPSEGFMERVEEGLNARIDRVAERRPERPSWFGMTFLRQLTAARSLAALTVLLVAGVGLWYAGLFHASLPTYVYQAGGANADMVANADMRGARLASLEGGTVRLANRHGFVQLQNGAGLSLLRATERSARYFLSLGAQQEGAIDRGSATFYVTKRASRGSFVVATPEYDITVTGTYFRVLPDLGGRLSTQVLEGSVVVTGSEGNHALRAGQSLVYDPEVGAYAVKSGGPVVSREEVPAMPDLESIAEHRVLVVACNVPFADVTIDGALRGSTPLRILLPRGTHKVRLEREGLVPVDTLVAVGGEGLSHLYAVLVQGTGQRPDRVALVAAAAPVRTAPARPAAARPADTATAMPPARSRHSLLALAEQAERTDWRQALSLYEQLVNEESASALVKQAALFAVGRIYAESARDRGAARETFLRYLALHPYGTFTRESLLRLAELEFETDQDRAVEYYLRYFEKYPDHYRVPELQYRVGLIYLQKGRNDEAVYMFRQALANMLHDQGGMRRRVYASLHKAVVASGDLESARQIQERYLSDAAGADSVR